MDRPSVNHRTRPTLAVSLHTGAGLLLPPVPAALCQSCLEMSEPIKCTAESERLLIQQLCTGCTFLPIIAQSALDQGEFWGQADTSHLFFRGGSSGTSWAVLRFICLRRCLEGLNVACYTAAYPLLLFNGFQFSHVAYQTQRTNFWRHEVCALKEISREVRGVLHTCVVLRTWRRLAGDLEGAKESNPWSFVLDRNDDQSWHEVSIISISRWSHTRHQCNL